MPTTIAISAYANGDDAMVAWAPSEFIAECRGFQLERKRMVKGAEKTDIVENRLGFAKDKPKSGDHRPSDQWPFQRFNWTDHVVDVGDKVRYRVTAMIKGSGTSLTTGPASAWTPWITLTPDAGGGFACFFNRGLILSQFVARYLRDNHLTPAGLKKQLRTSTDTFRTFLTGDLGARLLKLLADGKTGTTPLRAALYELDDDAVEAAMAAAGKEFQVVLSNGSGGSKDGNADARKFLKGKHITVIDRLLGSKGLGHNKFIAGGDFVWTGSTNCTTTGLCTQINNGLLVQSAAMAKLYRKQWDLLKKASPKVTDPAAFTPELIASNDKPTSFSVESAKVTVWFTPTSDGRDMDALSKIIMGAKNAILFLMFTPGQTGLHTLCAQRAAEKSMYVKGVVSTLGQTKADNEKNVLEVALVSSDHAFKPDHYSIVQPQGEGGDIGPWIGEVTRKDFLAQIGHAIVHSKVLLIDPLSDDPIVVTGSHNFSHNASKKNDENLVIIRGHKPLARAYATYVMSVYQHYRYRSYIREMEAEGKTPWSYLDDDDQWLKVELKSKAMEIDYWTSPA